ncbi:DCC1-like thiol-disulfide oxidoreductase family protein [Octadecabacter sp.]|nr:DCC1-like thiol-disulfide oxidoreductase family protein [Octadecabacter sp.]
MQELETGHIIAVMDGTCALCAFGARMVNHLDKRGTIKIAPIQGQAGAHLMSENGLEPLDPESWLLIEPEGRVSRDLDALIRLGQVTGGIGWVLTWLRVLPKPARNWMYARVARNRYAMFGRADMCAIPDEALRARLLA